VFLLIRRREFPHLKKIHLANCSQGAQPIRAAQSIEDFVNNWRQEGMDWDYWIKVVQESKATFARLINADPSDVAISFSVSSVVGTIASSLDFRGIRNRVVTTEIEFPTVPQIWYAHEKFGAQVDVVPVRSDGTVAIQDYEKHLDAKTLILSAPFVYYRNGYKQDLAELARLAHRSGALLMIDAYQGLGTSPIDVKAMDIDFLVSGNLKYLLGVPGIAFAYTKSPAQDLLVLPNSDTASTPCGPRCVSCIPRGTSPSPSLPMPRHSLQRTLSKDLQVCPALRTKLLCVA